MHLSVTVREIQAGYLSSSYFKDVYFYLPKIDYQVLKLLLEK